MLNKEPLAGSDAGEVVVSARLHGFVKATMAIPAGVEPNSAANNGDPLSAPLLPTMLPRLLHNPKFLKTDEVQALGTSSTPGPL